MFFSTKISYISCTTFEMIQLTLSWRSKELPVCNVCMCIIQCDQSLINFASLFPFMSSPIAFCALLPPDTAIHTAVCVGFKRHKQTIPLCVCEAITRGGELFWQMSQVRLSHTRSGQDSPPRIQHSGLCLRDYARKWCIWHQIDKNVGCWKQGEIVELFNPAWHWGGLLLVHPTGLK